MGVFSCVDSETPDQVIVWHCRTWKMANTINNVVNGTFELPAMRKDCYYCCNQVHSCGSVVLFVLPPQAPLRFLLLNNLSRQVGCCRSVQLQIHDLVKTRWREGHTLKTHSDTLTSSQRYMKDLVTTVYVGESKIPEH